MPIPSGYTECIPTPRTRRVVERIWRFKAKHDANSLILPDGRCDLMFRFRMDDQGNVHSVIPIVTGPARAPYKVDYTCGDMWIGLRLCPERGSAIWHDKILDAVNVAYRGSEAGCIIPAFSNIGATIKHVSDLENILKNIAEDVSLSSSQDWLVSAIDTMHLTGGRMRIGYLAEHVSRSVRQLHRVFTAHVGLSPKEYGAIIQFHRALRLVMVGGLSVLDAAFEAGYSDQAHLIRSFVKYGGFTPARIPTNISLPRLPI